MMSSRNLWFHLKHYRSLTTRTAISNHNKLNPSVVIPFPSSESDNDSGPTTVEKFPSEGQNSSNQSDCSKNFFEDYVCHELMIDRQQLKKINFLFDESIRKNYPTNESLIHLCKFLKIFFTVDDLTDNPRPFMTSYHKLYNRIMLLKEIGFRSFQVSMAIDYTEDIMKLCLNDLKRYLSYPPDQNGFDAMCKTMNIYGDCKLELIKYIETNNNDDIEKIPLNELRILCTAQYLFKNLNIPFIKSYHLCRKYSKSLNELCFTTIKTNVTYLQTNFNYSNNKIVQTGLFLMTNPENLTLIGTRLKSIVGDHLYGILISSPKILKLDFEQIVDNYHLIKEKCNGKFFNCSIELLPISTDKLTKMFEQMENNEDVKRTNLMSLGLDYLVLNQQKILERLEEIRREEIPVHHIPLSFYSNLFSDSEFDRALTDLTSDAELRIKYFLETRFNIDLDQIKNGLIVPIPINSTLAQRYTMANANRVVEYFISMNIDKELIIKSIPLILFDFRMVKNFFAQLNNNRRPKDREFFQSLFEHLQAATGEHRSQSTTTKSVPNDG